MAIKDLLTMEGNVQVVVSSADLREFTADLINQTRDLMREEAAKNKAEVYLPLTEVAKRLGVNRSSLWRWEKQGYLVPVRTGVKVRYRESDIIDIEEGRK